MIDNIPEGYVRVETHSDLEAFHAPATGRVILTGTPNPYEHPDPLAHDCDVMGCGSVTPHVVAILDLPEDTHSRLAKRLADAYGVRALGEFDKQPGAYRAAVAELEAAAAEYRAFKDGS